MFIPCGLAQAIFSPLWGKLAGDVSQPRFLCGIGTAFCAASFIVCGPSPLLPLKPSIELVLLGQLLLGELPPPPLLTTQKTVSCGRQWSGIKRKWGTSSREMGSKETDARKTSNEPCLKRVIARLRTDIRGLDLATLKRTPPFRGRGRSHLHSSVHRYDQSLYQ